MSRLSSKVLVAILAASLGLGSGAAEAVSLDDQSQGRGASDADRGSVSGAEGARDAAIPVDHPFDLALGETTMLDGGLSVTFASIVDDSRCPSGVECVSEGNAEIVIEVADAGESPVSLRLNTHPDLATSAPYSWYVVDLVGLSPRARTDSKTDQPYVATLLTSHPDWFRILKAVVGDANVEGTCMSIGTIDLALPDPDELAELVAKDRAGQPTPGTWVATGAPELARRVGGELIAEIERHAHVLIVDDEGRRVDEFTSFESSKGDLIWFLTGTQKTSKCRSDSDTER